jgi:hypothetical protein
VGEDLAAFLRFGAGELLGDGRHVDPRPVPIAADESKMTMPSWGRTSRFRECLASGRETQKNSRYAADA